MLFVGVDWGERHHDLCLLDQDGSVLAMVLLLFASLVSLVVRFRRSRGVERQQLKWLVYAAVTTFVFPLYWWSRGLLAWLSVWSIPVAIGLAVLRYRLYDIDRLINRTLVYGLLTVVLGLGYAALVLILGQLFGGVTQGPTQLGDRRGHPGRGGGIPAGPASHPDRSRPALQPAPP